MNNLKFNMEYICPIIKSGVHRSGWDYVIDKLLKYNDINSEIICDLYVDGTFHWNQQKLLKEKKLPYKKIWFGFVHHTPNQEYSKNNTSDFFKNTLFLESLNTCICIIVLTKYLQFWFETQFKKLGFKIYVVCIYHPTEFVNTNFSIDSFIKNKEKKLVQIGGWMRNSYAIYSLQLNQKNMSIQKAFLKGKKMENYHKPNYLYLDTLLSNELCDFSNCNNKDLLIYNKFKLLSIETAKNRIIAKYKNKILIDSSEINQKKNKSAYKIHPNKYVDGMINHLTELHDSVELINTLNNNNYDLLLSKNIVFLNLIDASACNTLIECVVRNTPIIINKLPAIVEILGENYPLYYDNFAEASEFATSFEKILSGHFYLRRLNKTKLKIENFIESFENKMCYILSQLK
jgi:hypothetical protein